MDIDISTVSPPAETGTDWLPVAAGAGAAGRGVAAAEWRLGLGLGLSASIHHADTNDTGSKPQWKIYLYVIENNIVCGQPIFCISIQSLPSPMIYVSLNQALN